MNLCESKASGRALVAGKLVLATEKPTSRPGTEKKEVTSLVLLQCPQADNIFFHEHPASIVTRFFRRIWAVLSRGSKSGDIARRAGRYRHRPPFVVIIHRREERKKEKIGSPGWRQHYHRRTGREKKLGRLPKWEAERRAGTGSSNTNPQSISLSLRPLQRTTKRERRWREEK